MYPPTLLLIAEARPFQPFRVYMADGRRFNLWHPEVLMVAQAGLGLWILHDEGQLEVLDGNAITALRTLGKADPGDFAGVVREDD